MLALLTQKNPMGHSSRERFGMCGIIGAIAQRNVAQIMLEGLRRLEYRGYDSAGLVVIQPETAAIQRIRALGKVECLAEQLQQEELIGHLGIAHTRWATHGKPSTQNAHPHCSEDQIAVVHNGIIENHEKLREQLTQAGYQFVTETDTEVVAHLLHQHTQAESQFLAAIQKTVTQLSGAYALGIINNAAPDRLYAVRKGSPLVIGIGIGEYFIASDPLALAPVTQKFIYLEDGEIAEITNKKLVIYDPQGNVVTDRKTQIIEANLKTASKGKYRHFMQKEIFEQPESISETINGHLFKQKISLTSFGYKAPEILPQIKQITLVACGTSYHAALVARYWLESICKIPTQVDIASEFRYRNPTIQENTLFIALSQSGETADTLAALQLAKQSGIAASLGICNVAHSSLARETDLFFLTHAGPEIGVAATKTFTAQLLALLLLTLCFEQIRFPKQANQHMQSILQLPQLIAQTLELDKTIQTLSSQFLQKNNALFLGRGVHFPIALEGALKLKELSYLHAEAYPAGELKHGPLALVDDQMPVIILAPKNELTEKLFSNIEEVQARQGQLFLLMDETLRFNSKEVAIIPMPTCPEILTPIVYTIPLQLLAYHIAVLKGTDVDHPRNLAKSVTVE